MSAASSRVDDRIAFAYRTRCAYGSLGNRRTCDCPWCVTWRTRDQHRRARAQGTTLRSRTAAAGMRLRRLAAARASGIVRVGPPKVLRRGTLLWPATERPRGGGRKRTS